LKFISKYTGRFDDIDCIEATVESLIWSRPLPDTIVPGDTTGTGELPIDPKYKVIVVPENEFIPSCC